MMCNVPRASLAVRIASPCARNLAPKRNPISVTKTKPRWVGASTCAAGDCGDTFRIRPDRTPPERTGSCTAIATTQEKMSHHRKLLRPKESNACGCGGVLSCDMVVANLARNEKDPATRHGLECLREVFVFFGEELVQPVEDEPHHHAVGMVAVDGRARVVAYQKIAHLVTHPRVRHRAIDVSLSKEFL